MENVEVIKENNKHAYLIIAHKLDYTFETLLLLLDDYRNDIYVHIDKKVKIINEDYYHQLIKKSNIYFLKERIKVTWGGYSQIKTELVLLKAATNNGHYSYYHLISGEDLPLRKQNYIHEFFDQNQGKEFIRFQSDSFSWFDRVGHYYLFQEMIGRGSDLSYKIERLMLLFANKLKFRRNANIKFQKGDNWFSITDDLARYVLSKKKFIRNTFKYTKCADEIFLQTIVYNSSFKDNLYHKEFDNNMVAIQRLIDWDRGGPYIYKKEDFQLIKDSNMLFARKFDCQIDKEIISLIKEQILHEEYNVNFN